MTSEESCARRCMLQGRAHMQGGVCCRAHMQGGACCRAHMQGGVCCMGRAHMQGGVCCRAHMQALDRSARAAEGECEAAVARRAQLALRQVAVWQAAAQATAQLQASQQQTAAQAAQQSDKVADHLKPDWGRCQIAWHVSTCGWKCSTASTKDGKSNS